MKPIIHTFNKTVYRIKTKDPNENVSIYEGNGQIGIFEFFTENNARKYIEEKNLKNTTLEKIKITTIEEIEIL